jgi:hypothetical protein
VKIPWLYKLIFLQYSKLKIEKDIRVRQTRKRNLYMVGLLNENSEKLRQLLAVYQGGSQI